MEWGWALAAGFIIITVVQLLTYYYLRRNRRDRSVWASSTGEGPRERGASPAPSPDRGGEDHSDRENLVQCSRCGTLNERDPMFDYCWNCANQLS